MRCTSYLFTVSRSMCTTRKRLYPYLARAMVRDTPSIQNGEEFFETGDCSDRTCPYEIAWTDYPDESGAHHTYAECANKGMCDRTTGEVKIIESKECGTFSSCDFHF